MKAIPLFLLSCLVCQGQPDLEWLLALPQQSASAVSDVTNGLQIWFKGESFTGAPPEGASISNWPSSSPINPNAYATNATAVNWPQLTNTFNALSGTNAIFFGSVYTNFFYVSNALHVSSNIASLTIVAACAFEDAGSTKTILQISKNGDSTGPRAEIEIYSTRAFRAQGRTADADGVAVVGGPAIITNAPWVLQADFLYSAGTINTYTNGTFYNTTNLATSGNTSATVPTAIRLGALTTAAGAQAFRGWIPEIRVYVPALSAGDRATVTAKLRSKYGI